VDDEEGTRMTACALSIVHGSRRRRSVSGADSEDEEEEDNLRDELRWV